MCTAKTTRFKETVSERRALRGLYGTPVFQSRDKNEARNGEFYKTKERKRDEGEETRERS